MSWPTLAGTQLPRSGDGPTLTRSLDEFLDQLPPEHLGFLHDRIWDRLSPWDRIHLRNKLRSRTIEGFCQLEHLPDHVFLYLIEFLQPRDLLHAAQVNRTWKNLFTSNKVLETACSRLFPGLLQSHLQHAGAERSLLFRDACRNFAMWKPEAFEILKHEPMVAIEGQPTTAASLYTHTIACSHGRLVRQDGRDTIVVDLRDGSEKAYRIPYDERKGRPFFTVAAASKDSVIVSEAGRFESDDLVLALGETSSDIWNHRAIWFLNLNVEHSERQWKSKSLPFRLEKCYTDSSSVIATCQNGQVFHWQWGGPLEELPKAQDLQRNSGPSYELTDKRPAAMFHPNGNVCYLVYMLNHFGDKSTENISSRTLGRYSSVQIEGNTKPSRLRVVEYAKTPEKSWIPGQTREWDLEMPLADGQLKIDYYTLRCTKADNNGTFTLAIYSCGAEGFSPSSDSATLFNVFTGKFSTVTLNYEAKRERGSDPGESFNHNSPRLLDSSPFPTSYRSQYDLYVWNRGIYRSHRTTRMSTGESQRQVSFDIQRPTTDGLKWNTRAVEAGKVLEWRSSQRGHQPPRLYVDDEHAVLAYAKGYTAYNRLTE